MTFTPPTWRTPGRARRLICDLRGRIRGTTGHLRTTDGNGYLFCRTCGQSMTNDNRVLGYGDPASWLPEVGEIVCDPHYRHQRVTQLFEEDGEWFVILEDGSRWDVPHSIDPADDHLESDHAEYRNWKP